MSEERIRQLAYDIWNSEGRPHGQEKRHWEMASKLFEAESSSFAAPAKPRAPRKKPVLKEIATAPEEKKPRSRSTRPKPAL